MKAIIIRQTGDPSVLVEADQPTPDLGPHDLLVKVHATAVNPVDYKIRSGAFRAPRPFPAIPGFDVSGVVERCGDDVAGFVVGDAVYAMPSVFAQGATAEYCVVDARTAAQKPASLSHMHAAALPLVTLTAWEALFDRAGLRKGETVLIEAGAGGVGHIAIQLAKHAGARVLTTAGRDESIALCKQLGADEVINYKQTDVAERVKRLTDGRGVDVSFDCVGKDVFTRAASCLAYAGRIVTIVGVPQDADLSTLFIRNQTLMPTFVGGAFLTGEAPVRHAEILREAAQLVVSGKLRPHVSATHGFSADALRQAHEQQESGRTLGKQVVRIAG